MSRLYLEVGQYAPQVQRYFEVFSPERVRIYLFDDLKRDPGSVLRDVALFLGVDPEGMSGVGGDEAYNTYVAPRNLVVRRVAGNRRVRQAAMTFLPHGVRRFAYRIILTKKAERPEPDPRAIKYLAEAYEGEIEELEHLLGRDLPSLHKKW